MIGYYDYTMLLTYISLLSASVGITVSLSDGGHPFVGCFCLLLCGLCDAFDGKVARTKPNRTDNQRKYGIQIDSLSDLVAFGVLPACIGAVLIRQSVIMANWEAQYGTKWYYIVGAILLFSILILYVLAAMIRLAYFNVSEEERQKTEGGVRKYYVGLPVTTAALIFPFILLIHYLTNMDVTIVYLITALVTGLAFLMKFHIRKPGIRGVVIMVILGTVETAALLLSYWLIPR